ncbi:hypothetical protein H827_YJM1477H00278, partial [Saccharomyces cerevisiae YJM1477]
MFNRFNKFQAAV